MMITIGGTEYDLGTFLEYAQTNEDGAYQDKLKYRLVQQNNLLVAICKAFAVKCEDYDKELADSATSEIAALDTRLSALEDAALDTRLSALEDAALEYK